MSDHMVIIFDGELRQSVLRGAVKINPASILREG